MLQLYICVALVMCVWVQLYKCLDQFASVNLSLHHLNCLHRSSVFIQVLWFIAHRLCINEQCEQDALKSKICIYIVPPVGYDMCYIIHAEPLIQPHNIVVVEFSLVIGFQTLNYILMPILQPERWLCTYPSMLYFPN